MAKIQQYEAPESLVPKVSQRGYHAAIESGRYIYRISREGTADLKSGINEIGSALQERERLKEKAEAKKEREEAKAERQADKEQARQDKLNRQALADAKAEDKAKTLAEKTNGIMERRALGERFTNERKAIEARLADHPEQIPAALDKWMNETVRPAYDEWKLKFSSKGGSEFAATAAETDMAHTRYHVGAASNTAAGNAVKTQIERLGKNAAEHIYNHPEDYEHESLKLQQDMNALVGHMQPGAVTGGKGVLNAPTPEDVTEEHLSIFRTLEGNLLGAHDHDVSPAGAIGRNQIMPETARAYGFDPSRLQDPKYNDGVAKTIISDLSKRYNGDLAAMAIGYNAGPGRADAWLKSGRDDKMLPQETQRYLANARDHGFIGPAGSPPGTPGVATSAAQNRQVQIEYNKAQRGAFMSYVLGTADTNPTAARQILATHQDRQYLTVGDLSRLPTAIDNAERHARLRTANEQTQATNRTNEVSDQRAMQYLSQLHDETGHPQFPKGWADAVKHDPALREETRAALLGANERLVNGPQTRTDNWWNPSTPRSSQYNPEQKSDPNTVSNMVGAIARPTTQSPAPSADEIIGRVANVDGLGNLSSQDAALLLGGINPKSGAAQQAFKDLNRNIEEMHQTIAPRNPDGSVNEAGEMKYRQALGDFLIQYKHAAASGNAVGSLNPTDPTYIRRDNFDQKYAAGHEDLVKAAGAGSDMPSDMALRQEYNDYVATQDKTNTPKHDFEHWKMETHPGQALKPLPEIFSNLTEGNPQDTQANAPHNERSDEEPKPWEMQDKDETAETETTSE